VAPAGTSTSLEAVPAPPPSPSTFASGCSASPPLAFSFSGAGPPLLESLPMGPSALLSAALHTGALWGPKAEALPEQKQWALQQTHLTPGTTPLPALKGPSRHTIVLEHPHSRQPARV